jgi:hypothetical protein
MKYEINLLPAVALDKRLEKVRKRREVRFLFATILSCSMVLISYGAIWWGLGLLESSLASQLVSRSKDRVSITERSREVNSKVVLLDNRIASYNLWTAHIPDVLFAVPGGIFVSRLELVEDPETLVVTGTASQGSEVVEYQTALEKLPWVDHVVAPLQNFARSPDAVVTFTIFHKKPDAL